MLEVVGDDEIRTVLEYVKRTADYTAPEDRRKLWWLIQRAIDHNYPKLRSECNNWQLEMGALWAGTT